MGFQGFCLLHLQLRSFRQAERRQGFKRKKEIASDIYSSVDMNRCQRHLIIVNSQKQKQSVAGDDSKSPPCAFKIPELDASFQIGISSIKILFSQLIDSTKTN